MTFSATATDDSVNVTSWQFQQYIAPAEVWDRAERTRPARDSDVRWCVASVLRDMLGLDAPEDLDEVDRVQVCVCLLWTSLRERDIV